jgi:cyclopropane fatty-acyl-phospholipid synthase-like methyltransferase
MVNGAISTRPGRSSPRRSDYAPNREIKIQVNVYCEPGRRVLDLGCGYGTPLERIRQRDAKGTGITISAEQVRYCRQKNLDVHNTDQLQHMAAIR